MKRIIALFGALVATITLALAQDPLERLYNYEVLTPQQNHNRVVPKPKVEGWAAERVKEPLDRGVVAVKTDAGVYVSWRLLEDDPETVVFNVYRSADGKSWRKLNSKPVAATTDFVDKKGTAGARYQVRAVVGRKEVESSKSTAVLEQNYVSIKFQGQYPAQKMAVGDLDGDGRYDYVIKQPQQVTDPGSWRRSNDTFKLEAYNADGEFLWRYDLGWNIEQGVWYSPYVVADLDGDGRAEVAVKTAPTDKDYRDEAGRVVGAVPYNYNGVAGSSEYGICPEYMSILDGLTGEEIDRVDWIPQGLEFGDYNRNNRNQLAIAYLDGRTPSVIMMRGTYRKMAANAYQLVDGHLQLQWAWSGDQENPVIRSQGAHQTVCADVDGDGREEVVLGSCVLDDNGQALWSAGVGHSDKAIVGEIDPDNPGLEILFGNEVPHEERGVILTDAATGRELWRIGKYTGHVGNAMAVDLDPSIPGLECIAAEDGGKSDVKEDNKYIFTCKGERIWKGEPVPGCTDWAWWDGDDIREMPVRKPGSRGFAMGKYRGDAGDENIEGSIMMIGDLFGDWREEIVTIVNGEMRIYTTTIPAQGRRVTLVQDPLYRSYIYNRSMGYTQSPMVSFFL